MEAALVSEMSGKEISHMLDGWESDIGFIQNL